MPRELPPATKLVNIMSSRESRESRAGTILSSLWHMYASLSGNFLRLYPVKPILVLMTHFYSDNTREFSFLYPVID